MPGTSDAIKAKLDQQEGSSSETTRDDIHAQVIRPERHGRMGGLGLGPTPSRVFSTSYSQSHYSKKYVSGLENEIRELKEKVGSYEANMAQLRETYEGRLGQLEEFMAMHRARMNSADDNALPHRHIEPPKAQSSPGVGSNETSLINAMTNEQRKKRSRMR